MSQPRKKPLASIAEVLAQWRSQSGIATRLDQAEIVGAWAELVGLQIASVTACESVTPDGVLRVHVTTAPWANELRLMTPRIIARLNAGRRGRVKEIRWIAAAPGRPGP